MPPRHGWPHRLRRHPLHTILTVTLDLGSASLSVGLATLWRPAQSGAPWIMWLFVPLVLALLAVTSMYRQDLQRNFLDEVGPLETAIAVAALLLLSCLLLADQSRAGLVVVPIWLCATVLMAAIRLARAGEQRWLRRHYYLESASRTLILGDDRFVDQLIMHMFQIPECGLLPVGVLGFGGCDATPDAKVDRYPAVPRVGDDIDDFNDVAVAMGIEDLIVSASAGSNDQVVAIIRAAHSLGIRVWVLPRMHDAIGSRARIEHLGGLPLLTVPPIDSHGWRFTIKHAIDRVLSALGLLLLAPIFAGLALLVQLGSPGPIFFRQQRVGHDAKTFDCLKFRSMRLPLDSDTAFDDSSSTFEDTPFALPTGSAPGGVEGPDRRTRVGKIMRATSLDELPQLINVLRGEMSLVGPRPERPEFAELFEHQIRRYGERHRVRAGITGWAQVHGLRGQTSIADRAEWDNYYIENWTLSLDVKIVFLTAIAVLTRAE